MTQVNDTTYSHLHGFNYVPSYAATVWDVVDSFDPTVVDREMGFAKSLDANALRVWTDVLSFQRDEDHFLDCWRQFFDLAKRHDLRLNVVLTNRWVDQLWWFGGINLTEVLGGVPSDEYRRYLSTFVTTFRDEPAVLMWDLCNEPFHSIVMAKGAAERERGDLPGVLAWDRLEEPMRPIVSEDCAETLLDLELSFWRGVAETVRDAGPSQPLTMALQRVHPFDHAAADALVDVLSAHLYHGAWEGPEAFGANCDVAADAANAVGKPLLASEICPGSQHPDVRGAMMRTSVAECERRNIGWFAWQLMAGRVVSSRPDRYDLNSPPDDKAIMYFVERDGTPRPGHDLATWQRSTKEGS